MAEKVDKALSASDQMLQHAFPLDVETIPPPLHQVDARRENDKAILENLADDQAECTRTLRQLCLACFGGSSFGRLLEEYAIISLPSVVVYINNLTAAGIFKYALMETFIIVTLFPGARVSPFINQST